MKMPHKRDRGQVGIGTLIVFIAMVLVAAIAAGVLINTAGFLQSQSEQTGQQSSSQVADRVQVVNTVGATDGSEVTDINMTVKKAPGADDVALSNTTLQYVDDDQIVNLVHQSVGQGTGADGQFYTYEVVDSDSSVSNSFVLNEPDDRAIVRLNISQPDGTVEGFSSAPGEGSSADVTFTTRAGGETSVTITVPDSLSQKSSVAL
jgi:flagellin FlaB